MDLFPLARRVLLTAYADTDAAIDGDQRRRPRPLPAQAVGPAGGEALPGGRRAAGGLGGRRPPAGAARPRCRAPLVGAVVRGPRLPGPQPGAVPLVPRRRRRRASGCWRRPDVDDRRAAGGDHRRTATCWSSRPTPSSPTGSGLTHHARPRTSTTWSWSAAARPGSAPRCTARPRACAPCWSSAPRPAGRPARAPGSRTTSASPTASPARSSTERARRQALKFGAEMRHRPRGRRRWRSAAPARVVRFADGGAIAAHTVDPGDRGLLPAAGRRRALDDLTGRGVFYGSALTEAPELRRPGRLHRRRRQLGRPGRDVLLPVRQPVRDLLVRGPSLERVDVALPDRADRRRSPNIEVRTCTEVVEAHGDEHLERLTLLRQRHRRDARRSDAGWLFVFIGAAPRTDWLDGVRRPRPARLRAHRAGPARATASGRRAGRWTATRTTWRPACPASSSPATCGPSRSSGSPRRSARARWRSRWCTATWRTDAARRPMSRALTSCDPDELRTLFLFE